MGQIPQEHIDKLCANKRPYEKGQAEARIRRARKFGKIISPTLTVYKCLFCWGYHIGHKKDFQIK